VATTNTVSDAFLAEHARLKAEVKELRKQVSTVDNRESGTIRYLRSEVRKREEALRTALETVSELEDRIRCLELER